MFCKKNIKHIFICLLYPLKMYFKEFFFHEYILKFHEYCFQELMYLFFKDCNTGLL